MLNPRDSSDWKHHKDHLHHIDGMPVVKSLTTEKEVKQMIKYNNERRAQSKSFLQSGKKHQNLILLRRVEQNRVLNHHN